MTDYGEQAIGIRRWWVYLAVLIFAVSTGLLSYQISSLNSNIGHHNSELGYAAQDVEATLQSTNCIVGLLLVTPEERSTLGIDEIAQACPGLDAAEVEAFIARGQDVVITP